MVAKMIARPPGTITDERWPEDAMDVTEAWAYTSGTFAKLPGAARCYFAAHQRSADGASSLVLLLEDLVVSGVEPVPPFKSVHSMYSGEYPAAQLTAVARSIGAFHAATAGSCGAPAVYGPPLPSCAAAGATLDLSTQPKGAFSPNDTTSTLYQSVFPHGGAYESCVQRLEAASAASLFHRQEETGLMQRIAVPKHAGRIMPDASEDLQKEVNPHVTSPNPHLHLTLSSPNLVTGIFPAARLRLWRAGGCCICWRTVQHGGCVESRDCGGKLSRGERGRREDRGAGGCSRRRGRGRS